MERVEVTLHVTDSVKLVFDRTGQKTVKVAVHGDIRDGVGYAYVDRTALLNVVRIVCEDPGE